MRAKSVAVVVGLAGGAHGLSAEAARLHLAARLLVERRTAEKLGALGAQRAELAHGVTHADDQPVERPGGEADTKEERGGKAQLC